MDPLLFVPVAILLSLTPGPNNICALNNGIRQGPAVAVLATFGRVAAFAIFLTVSALGLGAMLLASEKAFVVIKWVGAAYLFWLGVRTWRSAPHIAADAAASPAAAARPLRSLVLQEFLVAISNPKAVLLFAAVFPQFIKPDQPAAHQFLVLGSIYLLAEFVSSLVYGLGGQQLSRIISSRRGAKNMNRVTGGFFVGAGGLLLSVHR
ncbi:LysE family transporter [Xylophilus rhododendri]|uniref:LysE family transporter n=1 Tax=Xylophilus rhododendri TaxID=2697032 RepID=A0A857JB69_9BURK|nr:LysE family transporter [Xylophilus rhododendri]QHJ00392.1 LysE family transporter [Xylophilus rhododendri]